MRQSRKGCRWTTLASASKVPDADHEQGDTRGPQLLDPRERFQLFVDAVQDYAIFMLDPNGVVTSWNRGAERIQGYKAPEIIGKHFSVFYNRHDREKGIPERQLAFAKMHGKFQSEGLRIRKNGTRFWAAVTITTVKERSGALIGFGKVTRDVTQLRQAQAALEKEILEKRRAEKKLERSEKSLRELSIHLLTSHDQERRRLGRELHDRVGQYLVALKMNLETLRSRCGEALAFSESFRLLDASISEVRTLSYLLFPPLLEESGLKAAIQWYLDGFASRTGIQTSFNIENGFGRLSPDVELTLFRVLQETLTDVYRRFGSRTARVNLLKNGNTVELVVKDEGKGFRSELEAVATGEESPLGIGLRGMQERLRQLGGKLEVSSSRHGTFVRAVVLRDAKSPEQP